MPGETPHGITKKLTGQVERTQELLAANPGKTNTAKEWNIPPGWLQYAKETGAPTFITARKYTVLLNDTPIGIAKKMNAFVNRPQWWSELKAANPHKPTQSGTGNWVSLYPNEEIGIPDAWPETSLAVPVAELSVPGNQTEPPGLPAPGKTTTLDPGVVPHAQALLVKWAFQNPNDCNPSDYGRNPMDLLGGITPRTTQALSSFQTWWNKKQPTRPLNSAGELDTETYHALVEADNASNAPAQQQQGSPAQQQPSNQTPSTNMPKPPPEGFPKDFPWPFPSQQQPQPSQQQPSQQQPTPAPTPSGNTQPASTNGAPHGWPKEWPWPLIPTNAAPQQQPSQPSGPSQSTPAPDGPNAKTPTQSPSTNTPLLDSHLTAAERDQLLAYLAYGKDPDEMDRIAMERATDGYPLTAIALHRRATELRNQTPEDSGPPVIFVQNAESTADPNGGSGGGGSLLPALAILGAGFVLS
jgi:hypothetical protein